MALVAVLISPLFGGASAGEPVAACMVDQEPWGSLNHPHDSIYAEVFEEIAGEANLEFKISIGPLARVLDDVRTGICQFTITSWEPARADKLVRGAELASLDYGVLLRRGLELHGEPDLRGLSIATSRSLLIGEPFDTDPLVRKIPVYGYEQAVKMTAGGRADGAAGSIITLERYAVQQGMADKFGPSLVLSHVPLTVQENMSFAASDEAIRIDQAVSRLRETGRAAEIIARHMNR